MTERTPVLSLDGIDKAFGANPVLHGLDLTVVRGEAVVIRGPNGAGKSTLISIVIGLLRPDGGHVTAPSAFDLGYIQERPRLLEGATVSELLTMFARFRCGTGAAQACESCVEELQLGSILSVRVGQLSKGNAQRVQIACGIVGQPELIVCDEPSSGLDQDNFETMVASLSARRHDTAILVVEHGSRAAILSHRLQATNYELADGVLRERPVEGGIRLRIPMEPSVVELVARPSIGAAVIRCDDDIMEIVIPDSSIGEFMGSVGDIALEVVGHGTD